MFENRTPVVEWTKINLEFFDTAYKITLNGEFAPNPKIGHHINRMIQRFYFYIYPDDIYPERYLSNWEDIVVKKMHEIGIKKFCLIPINCWKKPYYRVDFFLCYDEQILKSEIEIVTSENAMFSDFPARMPYSYRVRSIFEAKKVFKNIIKDYVSMRNICEKFKFHGKLYCGLKIS